MRANDAICGLVVILLAVLMISLASALPAFPGQNYGPSLFPRILGSGLIVCGSLLMWRGIAARTPNTPWVEWAPWTSDRWRVSNFLLMLALLLLYILVSETVGFIPLGIFFLGAMFLWFGVRPLTAIVTAIVGTIVIHWFFATLLRVPLPRGWLNTIM